MFAQELSEAQQGEFGAQVKAGIVLRSPAMGVTEADVTSVVLTAGSIVATATLADGVPAGEWCTVRP